MTDDDLSPAHLTAHRVLIMHHRRDIRGCRCGWAELGRSHAGHVIDELERAGLALVVVDPTAPQPAVW